MTFQGCRNGAAVQMISVTRVVVINSNFTANHGDSLRISNSESVTINESSFSENHGNCLYASSSLVIINKNRFYNNGRAYSYTGRAVSVSNSMVVISKSFFSNNTANRANGGAIYASNSNITVDSSEFSNNIVTVTVTSSRTTYSGGAIYVYNRNGDFELQVNDTVFFGNRAYRGHGGAMYVYMVFVILIIQNGSEVQDQSSRR